MTDPNTIKATAAEVRQWALINGFTVAAKGRVPEHVKEAFTKATGRAAA